jgi:hypothetical protein
MRGRPVALMHAFLELGAACDDKRSHLDLIQEIETDRDLLAIHKTELESSPEGRALLGFQRELEPGEVD